MRIPSASAFQSSTIFLSSSVAISKYMEKMWPEPSAKLDTPYGAWFCADWSGYWGMYWSTPTRADGVGENGAVYKLSVPNSGFGTLKFSWGEGGWDMAC